jgi:CheY-like chemotaxis protein
MNVLDSDIFGILLADDSETDRYFVREALAESQIRNHLVELEDGAELMDYMNREGIYADPISSPRPDLILLDLNMPRKGGREALEEIKADPNLRRIPVIILTTSGDEEDIGACYDLGVNSYIRKPVTFDELVRVMRSIGDYWFDTVAIARPEDK